MLVPIAHATERRVLPAFDLIGMGGESLSSQTLERSGRWLLLYVQPDCAPCRDALERLSGKGKPLSADRIAVVVGGAEPAAAQRLAMAFPSLAGATWYADPTYRVRAVLKLPGAPVALGIRDLTLEWTMVGVLRDRVHMSSILRSWIVQAP